MTGNSECFGGVEERCSDYRGVAKGECFIRIYLLFLKIHIFFLSLHSV